MIQFAYDGQKFDFAERPTTGEFRAMLRWLGDGATQAENLIGLVAISIKRGRPAFQFSDLDAVPADVTAGIVEEITTRQQELDAAAAQAASQPAPGAEGATAAPDPYAGVPDSEVPPTSDGSAPSGPLPSGQLAAVTV